jgi:hypothetical protein
MSAADVVSITLLTLRVATVATLILLPIGASPICSHGVVSGGARSCKPP